MSKTYRKKKKIRKHTHTVHKLLFFKNALAASTSQFSTAKKTEESEAKHHGPGNQNKKLEDPKKDDHKSAVVGGITVI